MPGHAHRTTHKATLAPAWQGMEGTCQHIPPGCFLCCPWLTHGKSPGKLPPQPGAGLYRKGYSAEGNKGFAWRGQEERRVGQKQETGHRLSQPTGHWFRDQHCNQPRDSDLWGSHHSDPVCITMMGTVRSLWHIRFLPTGISFIWDLRERGSRTWRYEG